MLQVDVAVSKIAKYATQESGDTLEMVDRPHGGVSFILADGQRSGRGAKRISNIVARKAMILLAEGVRDGAAARAAHDYLYTHRQGQVSATLNIASVDLVTHTLVLSRNSHCPVYILTRGGLQTLDEPSQPVGVYRNTKPLVTEMPLEAPTVVVIFTDGLQNAGKRLGSPFDVATLLTEIPLEDISSARVIADMLFDRAYQLDNTRPTDDISILVLTVLDRPASRAGRHLHVTIPF